MSDEQKQTTSDYKASNDGSKMRLQMGIPVEAPAEKVAAPIHRTGGITHRMTVRDGIAGPLEVSSAMGGTRQAGPDPVRATAVGPQGQRISLSEARPDTVIDLGGALGSTQASVWEGLGYIVKDRENGGYRVVGEQSAPNAATTPAPVAPPQSPVVKPVEVNPADAAGVPPTSAEADIFQESTKPAVFEQAVATLTKGQTPNWAEMGRLSGESEDFASQAEALHGELLASGQKVLANVGVENSASFEAWALKNKPEESNAAIRAMLDRDVSKLAALGRQYAQERSAKIESLVEQANVQTTRIEGKLHISRASLGLSPTKGAGDFKTQWISLQQAIRDGHVEIAD